MVERKPNSSKDKCNVKSIAGQQLCDHQKNKMVKTKTATKGKNVSRTSTGKASEIAANEKRRSLRSTPLATYDFVGDSPNLSSKGSASGKKRGSGKVSKTSRSTKTQPSKSKPQRTAKTNAVATMVTPKTRTCKVVPQIPPASLSAKKKKDKKPLIPIQQPNLDDISPIVKDTTLDKRDPSQVKKRTLRSAEKAKSVVDTPSLSFIVPRTNLDSSNDSAIFVSPRRTMPHFTSEKTSTPADVPRKRKKTVKAVLKAKNTSTPIEIKPKKTYTAIKPRQSVSPVQRMDTPTSDYFSMELFETPDLSPSKPANAKKRARSPNRIFSLEEDSDSLPLNKSLDRSYKHRTKRKYESSKKADSKMEEWAEKVNSELEDIENFELSVEG